MQRNGQAGEDAASASPGETPTGDGIAGETSTGGLMAGDASATRSRGAQPTLSQRRATPRQFLHEVNVEMRKVAWPTRSETINYASVVLVTLVLVMALIFGLDTGFSQLSLDLFK